MLEPAATEENEEEIRWTDDRIRWTEDNDKHSSTKDKDKEDEDEEEEETAYIDPFKDPDPFDTFSFRFEHPLLSTKDAANNAAATNTTATTDKQHIELEVRGYKTDSDQVWQSTGLTLWRASEHLCNYMVQHSEMFHNRRILELGAGLGLCGILAHRLGRNSTVCITDGDSDALVHLRENMKRNQEPTKKTGDNDNVDSLLTTEGDNRTVTARQLIWGRDTTEQFLRKEPHGQRQQQTYDVLIASDIIYALVIVEPLWETVQLLLSRREKAVFVMAYARRDVPVTIDMVLKAAEEAGFSHELVDENPEGIWVYVFRWKVVEAEITSSS